MEQSFKISLNPLDSSIFNISYIDDEEDHINIENPFDYNEAIKFADNSNQNYFNFIISLKNQSFQIFKKENEKNIEFIENFSVKTQRLQKSPQIDFLIPKGQKLEINTIQKLEDLKFFVDENQFNNNITLNKFFKSKKNFKNEDTILSKSPEISIDLPKQISSKNILKENFEITYDSSNNNIFKIKNDKKDNDNLEHNVINNVNNFKIEKLQKKIYEKKCKKFKKEIQTQEILQKLMHNAENNFEIENEEEIRYKKALKKFSKALIKQALTSELKAFKKDIEVDISKIISKHYENLSKINLESQKKMEEIQKGNSNINMRINNKNSNLTFNCKICNKTQINSIKFKCSVCKGYDICEYCEENHFDNHPHPLIKIRSKELNPAFIKTIMFEDENNININNNNNNNYDENYIEKYIDFDINLNNKNDDINNFNCFNFNSNNDLIKYFANKNAYNNLNDNFSKHTSSNNNFNINNLDNLLNKKNNNKDIKNSNQEKYQITCINSNDVFEIKNSKSKEFKITLKLKNTGKETIPRPFYLECISTNSEINGKSIPININLKPGMTVNPEITLDISNLKKGIFLSVWRLQNAQREFLGQEIPLKIKIEKTEDLKIKEIYVEEKLNEEKINISEIKKRNNIDLPLQNEKEQEKLKSNKNDNINLPCKIISLEDYKKLRMSRNSESFKCLNSKPSLDLKIKKPVTDIYALADEIIKKFPEKNIKRKEIINALFKTGGNEKNSIEMAINESHNILPTWQPASL